MIFREIQQLNPSGEFLFMRNGSRIRAYTVRLRLHQVCKAVGVQDKSTHKARKIYASILLSSVVDTSIVISLMGHTDISCMEQYYHHNRKDIAAKSIVLRNCFKITCEIFTWFYVDIFAFGLQQFTSYFCTVPKYESKLSYY